MKRGTRVYLKGRRDKPGLICAVQPSLYDKSEPTRYWVLWRDCSKTDHEASQLEVRK